MDVSLSSLSKILLSTNDILLVGYPGYQSLKICWLLPMVLVRGPKRSPKLIRYFELLIVVAVQSNAPSFAFAGSFY